MGKGCSSNALNGTNTGGYSGEKNGHHHSGGKEYSEKLDSGEKL